MAIVQVQDLIDAGVHYGHRSSRWNPKMRPYIYGKRNLIHIIDLRETVRGMVRAYRFLQRTAAQGSLVLFVGTKRAAQESVIREASRCCMPYVSSRWIGGAFTNFRTIRSRLTRLEELEDLIRTGEIEQYSKKRRSALMRELKKIHRNLSGIRTLNRPPGAVVVVDSNHEHSAVREARKMGIPTVALIDTDSDPDTIDLAIPGNDDSIRSIDLVLQRLADAVLEGMQRLPREQREKFEAEFRNAHRPVVPPEDTTSEVHVPQEVAAPAEPVPATVPESPPAASTESATEAAAPPAESAPSEPPAPEPAADAPDEALKDESAPSS